MQFENNQYVIGVDFGTDSVRALIVNAMDGEEIVSSIFPYSRWNDGLYCDPNKHQFRQHPKDYMEGLLYVLQDCLDRAGESVRKKIKAISVDTTGSTPVAVDQYGTPLALLDSFQEDPDAMFILWKDHTATDESDEINAHAKTFDTDYLKFVGGAYSSEWYWSKLLHTIRSNEKVRNAAYSWVEHSDWIPFLLTGGTNAKEIKRNVCTAGHKALWAVEWGGFPPANFFLSLDPLLEKYTEYFFNTIYTTDKQAGHLCKEWATKLRLSENIVVGIGAMDAHMGAVGGQIKPCFLSKVMGTSTCDMLVAPLEQMQDRYVAGICGLVHGSIVPGMIGMEAGQSAFGDVYAWYKNLLSWPLKHLGRGNSELEKNIECIVDEILPALSIAAAAVSPSLDDELSLDWFNGRRTPNMNARVKAAVTGLDLGSDAVRFFRSLVEATCFGAKAIVDCFTEQNVNIQGLIGIGGVAKKSPFIMQMMADVLGMPIKISKSEQTSALGAAMFAATTSGIYKNVETAMDIMGKGFDKVYTPQENYRSLYNVRYKKYLELGKFEENELTSYF